MTPGWAQPWTAPDADTVTVARSATLYALDDDADLYTTPRRLYDAELANSRRGPGPWTVHAYRDVDNGWQPVAVHEIDVVRLTPGGGWIPTVDGVAMTEWTP